MKSFRQISAWLTLASYLFAGTLAHLWHDHEGHADCQSAPPEHACHTHDDHHHACHHDGAPETFADCGASDSVETEHGDHDRPHHCAVCEFHALTPLHAAPPALVMTDEATFVAAEPVAPAPMAAIVSLPPVRGPPAAV